MVTERYYSQKFACRTGDAVKRRHFMIESRRIRQIGVAASSSGGDQSQLIVHSAASYTQVTNQESRTLP
jgi:hypothetical protein